MLRLALLQLLQSADGLVTLFNVFQGINTVSIRSRLMNLVISCRKKRLHPSGSPGSSLNETQSTDVLKHGDGNLDSGSVAATSGGTPQGRDTIRTLHSDMESSGGQLLGQR